MGMATASSAVPEDASSSGPDGGDPWIFGMRGF
jgi:hypothetical protein